jgi:hypothetical protein
VNPARHPKLSFMAEAVLSSNPSARVKLSPLDVVVRRINVADFPANCWAVNERIVKDLNAMDHSAANLLHVLNGFQLIAAKS